MQSCKNLHRRLRVECDGKQLKLPKLQGIVVLNIPSYMGGADLWGAPSAGKGFQPQSFNDGLLELVGFKNSSEVSATFLGFPSSLLAGFLFLIWTLFTCSFDTADGSLQGCAGLHADAIGAGQVHHHHHFWGRCCPCPGRWRTLDATTLRYQHHAPQLRATVVP